MKKVSVIFFKTTAGGEPVRNWLKSLKPEQDRKKIGFDLKTLEFGWPVGVPLCRALGSGLHVLRSALPSGRIARVLFYVDRRGDLVVLHGFIKKTQQTNSSDLALARANKNIHESGWRGNE